MPSTEVEVEVEVADRLVSIDLLGNNAKHDGMPSN